MQTSKIVNEEILPVLDYVTRNYDISQKNLGTLNSGVFVIRPFKDDINQTFLSYVFKSNYFDEFLKKLIAGSTIIHLYQKDFIFFDFPLPNIQEQTAIAAILSDMDAEIEALQTKLSKVKLVKQGAMQELLTGKIRLVNTSSQSRRLSENRIIPVAAHILGGHIVNKLYRSKGWGRTKLQKSMHLVGYCCQLDFGGEYVRNIAGPDDQLLMNHIDSKFRQYRHVRIDVTNDDSGRKHYNYIPTSMITEVEQAFERYPAETQKAINNLLNKIKKMDLARTEIVSTLYAVWNISLPKTVRQSANLTISRYLILFWNRGEKLKEDNDNSSQEAAAEAIENNIRKKIVERQIVNPLYYEKMSAILQRLISDRKNGIIAYKNLLDKYLELLRKIENPGENGDFPLSVRHSAAKRAFYTPFGENEALANELYDAVVRSRQDDLILEETLSK
jgi:hypothetical protein